MKDTFSQKIKNENAAPDGQRNPRTAAAARPASGIFPSTINHQPSTKID
jgi:hypothetical protein